MKYTGRFPVPGFSLLIVAFILIPMMSVPGCSGKSEEDRIVESLDNVADYAEDGDLDSIVEYLSPDYSDKDGRSAVDVQEFLVTHFDKYPGIAVNLLSTRIISLETPSAEVETEVSLSSGAAKMFRKMIRIAGYYYRFKFKLVKAEDKWKIKSAGWYRVTLAELYPESAKILRKLFPNL